MDLPGQLSDVPEKALRVRKIVASLWPSTDAGLWYVLVHVSFLVRCGNLDRSNRVQPSGLLIDRDVPTLSPMFCISPFLQHYSIWYTFLSSIASLSTLLSRPCSGLKPLQESLPSHFWLPSHHHLKAE